jgi:hypothetical protein
MQNLSDAEFTYQMHNLLYTELVRYSTCQIRNLSDTQLVRYSTFQILNLSDSQLVYPTQNDQTAR